MINDASGWWCFSQKCFPEKILWKKSGPKHPSVSVSYKQKACHNFLRRTAGVEDKLGSPCWVGHIKMTGKHSLKLTWHSTWKKANRPSQKETIVFQHIPTIHFQVLYVSSREGKSAQKAGIAWGLYMKNPLKYPEFFGLEMITAGRFGVPGTLVIQWDTVFCSFIKLCFLLLQMTCIYT